MCLGDARKTGALTHSLTFISTCTTFGLLVTISIVLFLAFLYYVISWFLAPLEACCHHSPPAAPTLQRFTLPGAITGLPYTPLEMSLYRLFWDYLPLKHYPEVNMQGAADRFPS